MTKGKMKKFFYLYGWIFVRPRRWFFWKMVCETNLHLLPKKDGTFGYYQMPNIHWWLLYKTVYRFCSWLNWEAWRVFCKHEKGWLKHKPLIAKIIHRIGQTTAGFASSGGECFHCSSKRGCPVELSNDETGTNFILERTWTEGSEDGTDYRFCGTTICPVCGYRRYYEDGSL